MTMLKRARLKLYGWAFVTHPSRRTRLQRLLVHHHRRKHAAAWRRMTDPREYQ